MGRRIALKPMIGGKAKREKFSVCDIEAHKWVNFKILGWYNGQNYKEFWKLKDFIEFIFTQRERVIYAHFGGIYDFLFIIQAVLETTDYKIMSMIPRGSGLLCFDIVRKNPRTGKLETRSFKDSSALLPFSLANITKSFGVKHVKQDFNFETWDGKVTEKLRGYLKDDCRGLWESLDKYYELPLIKRAGGAATMASQSLKVFRLFMEEEINSLKPKVDDFVRLGYYGGRTEIFKPHYEDKSETEPLYYLDVNSLYPDVMKNNDFPTNFKCWTYKYQPKEMGFYEAVIEVPEDMYMPPLPYVAEINKSKKLIYPTGRLKGVWSTVQIEYARSLGCKLISTDKGVLFRNGGPIFKTFIEAMYNLRMEAKEKGDGVGDIVYKLIMNSNYGRHGLNTKREQLVFDNFQLGFKPHSSMKIKRYGKEYTVRLGTEDIEMENTYTNVAISAWVTSLAGIKMHKLMNPIADKIYYTDSVTKDRMIMVKESGQIKVMKIEDIFNYGIDDNKLGKESKILSGLETISYNPHNKMMEWKNVKRVIRHKTDKKIFITRDNKGCSVTTEDHSFIDADNTKIKPNELKTLFSQKDLGHLSVESFRCLDLKSILPSEVRGSGTTYKLCFDDSYCWYYRDVKEKRRSEPIKFRVRRYYEGHDLENLLKIIGYYIAEGSISDFETASRFSFAISSDKTDLHEEIIAYLIKFFPDSTFGHIKSSDKDNTHKIINGSFLLCAVFKALGGQGSKNKYIPDFIFNLPNEMKKVFLDWLILGDGSKKFGKFNSASYVEKNFRYETTSFGLINQICALSSLLGYCYGVSYREEKKSWTLATSEYNRDYKPKIKEITYDDYVYDLQVDDNNNFFDCEGMIGLHNTDSMFTTVKLPTGDAIGELKDECPKDPIYKAVFLLPKTYVIEGSDKSEKKFKKLAMKGFDKRKISCFEYQDFFTALEGDLRHMKVTHDERFAKFKTAAKKGNLTTLLPSQDKAIRSLYDKRVVVKEKGKWDTKPLHIK